MPTEQKSIVCYCQECRGLHSHSNKSEFQKQMEYYAELDQKNEAAFQVKKQLESAAKAKEQSKRFFPVSEVQVKVW